MQVRYCSGRRGAGRRDALLLSQPRQDQEDRRRLHGNDLQSDKGGAQAPLGTASSWGSHARGAKFRREVV
jgi:hypothetical protein